MSICFAPTTHGAIPDLWTLPAVRSNPDDYGLSLTNSNGVDVLLALGLPPDPTGEPLPIDTFAGLVTAALRRHLGQRSPELAATVSAGPGRMTMSTCGRREGYVEKRLGDLARLVQRSRAVGCHAYHLGLSRRAAGRRRFTEPSPRVFPDRRRHLRIVVRATDMLAAHAPSGEHGGMALQVRPFEALAP